MNQNEITTQQLQNSLPQAAPAPFRGSKEGAEPATQQLQTPLPQAAPSPFSGSKEGALILRTANQWIHQATQQPPLTDLWHQRGLFYQSQITCIFGDSGAGKSALATEIGVDFARQYNNFDVLYADFRSTGTDFADRFVGTDSHFYFPENFYRVEFDPQAPVSKGANPVLQDLESLVQQVHPHLLIIDDLSALTLMPGAGSPDSIMQAISQLSQRHGITVIVTLTISKRSPHSPITEQDLGRYRPIWAYAQSLVALRRSIANPGMTYIKQLKRSYGGQIEYGHTNVMLCQLEAANSGLTTLEPLEVTSEQEQLRAPTTNHVLENIQLCADWRADGFTVRQIANFTNLSPATVSRYLRRYDQACDKLMKRETALATDATQPLRKDPNETELLQTPDPQAADIINPYKSMKHETPQSAEVEAQRAAPRMPQGARPFMAESPHCEPTNANMGVNRDAVAVLYPLCHKSPKTDVPM